MTWKVQGRWEDGELGGSLGGGREVRVDWGCEESRGGT